MMFLLAFAWTCSLSVSFSTVKYQFSSAEVWFTTKQSGLPWVTFTNSSDIMTCILFGIQVHIKFRWCHLNITMQYALEQTGQGSEAHNTVSHYIHLLYYMELSFWTFKCVEEPLVTTYGKSRGYKDSVFGCIR